MGNCIHCGKHAGFFRRRHQQCANAHFSGKQQILALLETLLETSQDVVALGRRIKEISQSHFVDPSSLRRILVQGWEKAVERAFEDGVLSLQEEIQLTELRNQFGLTQDDLNHAGAFSKVVKGAVLRESLDGRIPERVQVDGLIPFNLQKAENLVWLFQDVDYLEQKTRREYVGGSSGASFRIAKGIYYRVGSFRGQPIERTEVVHSDTGFLGFTDRHIYFAGQRKKFRLRYNKIVSFEPYSDGIGVHRDAANAQLQCFVTGDGWFTYNLVVSLARI